MFERTRKESVTQPDTGASELPARPSRSQAPRGGGEAAVIGRSIKISGDLRGDEDLRIEGDVTGTVELRNSSLTIGKEGRIKADVYAKNVIIEGHMEGDVYASERVSVRSSAHVIGNATAPRVGIEEGAKFKGSVEMDQETVNRAFGTKSAGPSQASQKPAEAAGPSAASTGAVAKEAAAR